MDPQVVQVSDTNHQTYVMPPMSESDNAWSHVTHGWSHRVSHVTLVKEACHTYELVTPHM